MKTIFKTLFGGLLALGFASPLAHGQANTVYNTTLSAAVTALTQQTVCLTSTTNIVAPSASAAGSIIFVDREEMQVVGPVVGSCVPVLRGGPDGTPTQLHASGIWVWYGDPTWFSAKPAGQEQWGSTCTAAALYASPIIYVKTGNWAVCDSNSRIGYGGPWGSGGNLPASITKVSDAAYTALATDSIIDYTAITTTRVVTLPAATALPNKVYVIQNTSTGTGQIELATVNASSTLDCGGTGYGGCTVFSNGTTWNTNK
jgi:hypothetical protein